jgi:hypothetical protein
MNFYWKEVEYCPQSAKQAANKKDRDFWLGLAAGWESMLERYRKLTAARAMADPSSRNNKSEQAA